MVSPARPFAPHLNNKDLQDFKTIKNNKLIICEGFKNYRQWAQQTTIVFTALETNHVLLEGVAAEMQTRGICYYVATTRCGGCPYYYTFYIYGLYVPS